MKKFILTNWLLLCIFLGFAQKQANTWYFGNRIGLDFNQVPPQPLNDGMLNSIEGSSTISDNNGKLLFYSNGVAIMNRQHLLMKNGGALVGNLSSTNNVLFVPLPGNDSIYYVFTVGAANEGTQLFLFSIVNMKGDNGFGEVDANIKNSLIEERIFEKLAAIRHCNKRDVWIVVRKWDSDEYHSYLLTANGLNTTPVISNTGLFISGNELNALGTLKFSAKGTKLAAVHSFANDAVELMDFDNRTGILANPKVLYPNPVPPAFAYKGVYGAEFSPDGRLLYVTSNNSPTEASVLYQFDITSNNAATIMASKQIIYQTSAFSAGALQTGPDLKIYMAIWNAGFLSAINDPDVYGAGCNFNLTQVNYAPNQVQYGLPTFVQSFFDSTSNPYDFTRMPGNCLERTISFKLSRLSGIDSLKWNFGDAQQSQVLEPTHTYAAPGFYDVTLIVYKIDCSGLNDTILRKIWIAGTDKFLGADTSSCNALQLEIGVEDIYGVNYLWNTGAATNKIITNMFGDYWLELEQNGCRIRDSLRVSPLPKPVVSLGPDTTICRYKPVILSTGGSFFDTYLWSTGETTPSINVNKTGTYYITVTKSSCETSDTIRIFPGDCDIYIPSAFTPNNDGLNETFGASENAAVQYFSLQIYNKWGELIFNSNAITQKWDGTFKGKHMPNGAYLWMLTYVNRRGKKIYEQGTVMLIR